MRLETVVGTLSAIGVGVLIVLSQMSSNDTTSTAASTTLTTAYVLRTTTTTSPPTTTSTSTSTTSTTSTTTAPTTPTTDAPTTTTTIPINPPDVKIRVIDGGASKGAAGMVKAYLEGLGFVMRSEKKGVETVAGTTIMYAPGKEIEGRGVAARMPVPVQNVVEGVGPNWDTYGVNKVDVLVILGP